MPDCVKEICYRLRVYFTIFLFFCTKCMYKIEKEFWEIRDNSMMVMSWLNYEYKKIGNWF